MQHYMQKHVRRARMALTALACLSLVGCFNTIQTSEVMSDYGYTVPGKDFVTLPLDDVFSCMRETGALEG